MPLPLKIHMNPIVVLICSFCILCSIAPAQERLLSPEEFLGYGRGERFTRHHQAVDYFKHVISVTPNAAFFQYGETYEHRPLVYVAITSPANFKNLEAIRLNNLRRAGFEKGAVSEDKTAIVWLSYNVHGNEASSLEAAMWTLYELANTNNKQAQAWLQNTVVIIDPCLNPDGRDRYVNFYYQFGNRPPNPNPNAAEHREPWPGGRFNHYLFDLNRDWAWATQAESQQRLKIYHQWLPHIHVDFHEQGYNNPYYFAPAAEPFHEVITPWQREFQTLIGRNNAKYFDNQGWLYFTKEIFDLYYPSYGDTYPTYNGAIGMTYEQAGSGLGGLTITTETGEPLTLKDRIIHHLTTGLSTVEITAQNAARVVDEFEKYYRENSTNPASAYKTYVIKSDNNPDKVAKLLSWLDMHMIRYGHSASSGSFRGFDFRSQTNTNVAVTGNDIIISVFQPKSRFITTIFEPRSRLSDSLTYDITAWNLIYAFDLKAYALTERLNVGKPYQHATPAATVASDPVYAYLFRYESIKDAGLLSSLMQEGIAVRTAAKGFTVNGNFFAPGTLVVPRGNNTDIVDLDYRIRRIAKQWNTTYYTTPTGFVEKGKDFGSNSLWFLGAPKIAVLFGPQTSPLSSGEIWHFFEQQIQYPITQIGVDHLKSTTLANYDVLIVPEGNYTVFGDETLKIVSEWVTNGGKLIVIGNALRSFADKKYFGLKKRETEDEKSSEDKKEKKKVTETELTKFEDAERKRIAESISGAIYKVTLDNSHPLAFGLRSDYYSLKTNSLSFPYLEKGWNVGTLRGAVKPVQGFAGFTANRTLENSLVFGVEEKGQGQVVYLVDNPLFRCFWENGKLLFSNAVFMVGR